MINGSKLETIKGLGHKASFAVDAGGDTWDGVMLVIGDDNGYSGESGETDWTVSPPTLYQRAA